MTSAVQASVAEEASDIDIRSPLQSGFFVPASHSFVVTLDGPSVHLAWCRGEKSFAPTNLWLMESRSQSNRVNFETSRILAHPGTMINYQEGLFRFSGSLGAPQSKASDISWELMGTRGMGGSSMPDKQPPFTFTCVCSDPIHRVQHDEAR